MKPDPACILVLRSDLAVYAAPHHLSPDQVAQLKAEIKVALPGMRVVIVENAHVIDAREEAHKPRVD